RDGLSDLEAVLGLHEGHVVHDEDTGLPDRGEIFHGPLRADHPVASTVERPRAAERAVPRTSARELDRRARSERAEEVAAAVPQEISGRHERVETLDQARGRSFA